MTWLFRHILALATLAACLALPAQAQVQTGEVPPAGPQPHLYAVLEKDAPPPSYIHTGPTRCAFIWAPGTYKPDEQLWRFRTLNAADLAPRLEITLKLDDGMDFLKSEESSDGLGVYMLFRSRQHSRQLLLLWLRFQDGATESERFQMPIDMDIEQLLVSPVGAYIRGLESTSPVIFYLNPDNRQAVILPFGPDKGNRLVGCGLEKRTGRLWVATVRTGSNPGPVPSVVRVYAYGQLTLEAPIEGMGTEFSPATLFLASDTVSGLWLGTWGTRGSEYAQGPLVLSGLQAKLPLRRYVDSAGFFAYEPPRKAQRHFNRYSRRKHVNLNLRFYTHPPKPLPGGGYMLASERYYIRVTSGPSPFFTPFSPYYGTSRAYETAFVLRVDCDAQGNLRRLHSTELPSQIYPVLEQRAVVLPDRPPLCLQNDAPLMALPDPDDARRIRWQQVPPQALGMAANQQIGVDGLIEEGTVAFAFGSGRDPVTRARFFFLARLPEGAQ